MSVFGLGRKKRDNSAERRALQAQQAADARQAAVEEQNRLTQIARNRGGFLSLAGNDISRGTLLA